ncbi:MAG: KpsF/GutQ family sugar-phosphate isomerase [Bacteroidota bacterium]
MGIDHTKIAEQVFAIEARAIQKLSANLTDHFNQIIELLLTIKGRLVVTGIGKSGLIGRKMVATFASTGTPSFFLHPTEAFHGDLGMVTKADVVLAISKSGETSEILQLIPYFKHKKIPIIAISTTENATLVKNADFFLEIVIDREACPLDLAPTASSTATLAMGDALAMALMKARRFQAEDFAQFHPGGQLGKKLLTEVQTVMYQRNLPIVSPRTKMEELINTMTKGKLGLVVVQHRQQIQGIITDGDLRRLMKNQQATFFDLVAQDFMTRNPVQIVPTTTLKAAELLMVQHQITSLLVAKDHQLVGVVQIYQVA